MKYLLTIEDATWDRLKAISADTDKPISRLIRRAIEDMLMYTTLSYEERVRRGLTPPVNSATVQHSPTNHEQVEVTNGYTTQGQKASATSLSPREFRPVPKTESKK